MASKSVEEERSLLVRVVGEAYDELRVLPGLDANGPALVWFAEHLLTAYHEDGETR
ncbi:hypothetical protein [Actinophytocola sp.]|jgi:hypothetical protein|uniref:hypothetical protein n=1 Tax=Actinophytocola sp. TaxID=1872138 RepID=UPI002ED82534